MSRCARAERSRRRASARRKGIGFKTHRRVRVTARLRRNERFPPGDLSSALRWQHPILMEDTNRHGGECPARVRMEAGRFGGGE